MVKHDKGKVKEKANTKKGRRERRKETRKRRLSRMRSKTTLEQTAGYILRQAASLGTSGIM